MIIKVVGRYDEIFARPERHTEACCPAAGARGGGAQDPLAWPMGAEVGLQEGRAWRNHLLLLATTPGNLVTILVAANEFARYAWAHISGPGM